LGCKNGKVMPKMYDGYFTAGKWISLLLIEFEGKAHKMRFNSYRVDTQSNERSTWTRIPQNPIDFIIFGFYAEI